RSLHLQSPQFAGVVAVLSVQPSIYKTLRNGWQLICSAVIGALAGAVALYFLGNSFLVMGIVAFVLMTLHVKIKWTSSLQIAVVIAINALGSTSLFFGYSAMNQLGLVLTGTISGMLLNFFHKPIHQERAEVLVSQSEGMLRALLYYFYLDLQDNKVTPFPEMKKQINEVRTYIERGQGVARLINEDARFRSTHTGDMLTLFRTFERMVGNIEDLSKSLQKMQTAHLEVVFLKKIILLIIQLQENKMSGKHIHVQFVSRILRKRMDGLWRHQHLFEQHAELVAFYLIYDILHEYLQALHSLKKIDLDISTNYHPDIEGLKDEISALVLVNHPPEKREMRMQKS
ncbi:MAG: FUSC family protein, partial [Tumebacillaceae bacterium]